MHSAGFEPTIPAFKRPQIHDLDRKGTRIVAIDFGTVLFHADSSGRAV